MTVIAVAHTGFTVRELDPAIELWRDVLGFTLDRRFELHGTFAAEVTGVPDARITAATLSLGGHVVELLQYLEPRERGHVRGRPCDTGAVHLALTVTDLDELLAACSARGWLAAGAPRTLDSGPRAGTRFAYLQDSDGTTLELVEPARPR